LTGWDAEDHVRVEDVLWFVAVRAPHGGTHDALEDVGEGTRVAVFQLRCTLFELGLGWGGVGEFGPGELHPELRAHVYLLV